MRKTVKKIGLVCLAIVGILLWPSAVAKAETLPSSVDNNTVTVGDKITLTVSCPENHLATLTVSYDSQMLERESGGTVGNDGSLGINLGSQGVMSAKFVFSAKKTGSTTIIVTPNAVTDAATWEDKTKNYSSVSISITVKEKEKPVVKLSDNNKLSYLALSEGTLSPDFSSGVNNYEAEVLYEVENVKVYTELSDSKAYVDSITGNKNLQVGENYISVKVVAENGEERTYTILVRRLKAGQEIGAPEVDDKDAKFTYKDVTYVSVKEGIPDVKIPSGFVPSVISINERQYPCFVHDALNLSVLYLCPEGKKDGALFLYDGSSNAVYPFVYLEHNENYVVALPTGPDTIPQGYEAVELEIPSLGMVTAYQNKGLSLEGSTENSFYLLYCFTSRNTFEWYRYDAVEGTFQRYLVEKMPEVVEKPSETEEKPSDTQAALDNVGVEKLNQLNKLYLICMVGAVALVFILGIITLIALRMKNRASEEDEEDEEEAEEYEADEEEDFIDEEDDHVYEALLDEEEVATIAREVETLEEVVSEETAAEQDIEEKDTEEQDTEEKDSIEKVQEEEHKKEVPEEDEDDYKRGYVDDISEESEKEDGEFEFLDL